MGKSAKKKKLSSASKDGVGDKPDDRTSTSVNDKETIDTDNDLSKKSPAVSGPTTRSKSDKATKRTEWSEIDCCSEQHSQKHESDSNDSNESPYPVDYVKHSKHLKKIADQIMNKITVFDGKDYTNWMNLILKWASIYGLQR